MLSARWINALLFGSLLVLVGLTLHEVLNNEDNVSVWMPLVACIFLLISVASLQIYLMAWSEGAFIVLGLLSFWALGRHLDQERRPLLFLGSILVGFSLITRYAGVAYLGTGLIGVLMIGARSWARRFFDAIVVVFFGSLPLLLWTLRNMSAAGTSTNRELLYHPISTSKLWEGLTTATSWFFIPETLPTVIKIGLFTFLVVFFAGLFLFSVRETAILNQKTWMKTIRETPAMIQLVFIFLIVYSLFLIFSISFFDANTPLDARILSPIYIALVFLLAYGIGLFFQSGTRNRSTQFIGLGLLIIFCGFSINRLVALVGPAYSSGIGFNHENWRQSETIALVKQLPEGTIIYSNAPAAIYLHTGLAAGRIPKPFESVNQRANPFYDEEIKALEMALLNDTAVLVFFDGGRVNTQPSQEELIAILGVDVQANAADGRIYGNPGGD